LLWCSYPIYRAETVDAEFLENWQPGIDQIAFRGTGCNNAEKGAGYDENVAFESAYNIFRQAHDEGHWSL